MPCVRSFSSSFWVQSQLQQAHGSVPFSCRQLRRKCASFTLSRSKYSSQYGRSSDSGGSQKQVSTHCATPFSVTRACHMLCKYSSPAIESVRLFKSLDRDQRNTFVACFLGWALDAFDFFLLTFVIAAMAHDFGTSIAKLSYAITLTLAMRPLGAFIFGLLGDRFGRRIPLMIDIIFYSAMELLTAFSPNYTWLLIFRALYGIGMGGEWGLGASLAMETLPTAARGLFSGILQQGYAFGYLLAAVVYWTVFPFFGWRGLFVAGVLPAFLVIFIRSRVPELPAWLRRPFAPSDFRKKVLTVLQRHWPLIPCVILLMTAFNAMSHGTQDMYQTFLGEQRHYGVTQQAATAGLYAFAAI